MIAALEGAGLALGRRAELGAPMAAHVQEGAEDASLVPDHEHALVADAHGPIAARGVELVGAPHTDPEAAEQPLLLARPDRRVVIEPPGQRPGEAVAGVRGGAHAASTAGKTMTFRSASPPSIAAIASLICSSG